MSDEPPLPRGRAGLERTGDPPRRASGPPGPWPILFVILALVLLALVPAVIGQRIAAIQSKVSSVLEPARALGSELALVHSGQMSRVQGHLITGDPIYRQSYFQLQEREERLFAGLAERLAGTDLRVRTHLAALQTAATRWQFSHRFTLDQPPSAIEAARVVQEEQRLYDAVRAAAEALTGALDAEIRGARQEMDRARSLQLFLTVLLAGVALLATLAVAGIGARTRALYREADRRRAEALRARREMEAVLEATGDGVLGVDLEGRCTTLNATGSRLLGRSEVEARGRSLHDLLHGRAPEAEAHPREECPLLAALAGEGRTERTEDVIWRRDGRSFPARVHLRPLRDGREVRGGVLTLTDMTEVRTAEALLRQAVEDRDHMVAVVSHDLRNPLGVIAAASEMLVEMELPEERRREQLGIIRRAAWRMTRLIEDLLDVARIEGGRFALETAPVHVDTLLGEALELHLPSARAQGVELVLERGSGADWVVGDHERVLQVLSNLVGNGLKHTPSGGRVTLSAQRRGDGVELRVSDTGDGIPSRDLGRIFDRFWQARSTRRSGAGLGLTIVRGIVEAHGSEIGVESEPGRGTAFHFTLPAKPEGEPASAGADPSEAGTAPSGVPGVEKR